MKSKLSPVAPALLAIALAAGCSRGRPAKPAAASAASGYVTLTPAQRGRVHLATATLSPYHRTIDTTGTVGFDGDLATTVIAPISGPVSRLVVQLGAHVKAGDPLAQVSSPDYAAAVTAYRKAVVTEQNLRRVAKLDGQLFKADALARRDLEQAQTDAANATADREAALQQLQSIGVPDAAIRALQEGRAPRDASGVIRSPIAGTVVEKLVSPGQLLQAGTTPCFTIADLSQVWVTANVYEAQLADVQVGDAAEIITDASPHPIPGTVDNISAILDPNTRAIGVRVVAKNPGEILKKQMYVDVRIRSRQERRGLLIPVAAILRDEENLPFVYVEQRAGGGFARQRVTLGYRVGNAYEVTAGLKPGESFVADGALFLQFEQNQ